MINKSFLSINLEVYMMPPQMAGKICKKEVYRCRFLYKVFVFKREFSCLDKF